MNYEERQNELKWGGEIGKKKLAIIDAVDAIACYQKIDPNTPRHLDRILAVIADINRERAPYIEKVKNEAEEHHKKIMKATGKK